MHEMSVSLLRLRPPRLLALLWLVLAGSLSPARAVLACESPAGSPSTELRRCLLIEQGRRAQFEGRLADADVAWQQLRELDPRDPAVPLLVLETTWWRNVLDEGSTEHDETIRRTAAEAARLAQARLERDPDDAVALYQLGDAQMHRARLEGIRGHMLSAGRAGERGRKALERALALRPDMTEIKYPLGLYYYYASIGPRLLEWVSWLWFVPRGDRERGLDYLRQVRDAGGPHSTDARFILMNVQTYHGPLDLPAALAAGRELHRRFPDNALFHSELIEVLLKIGLYDEAIEKSWQLERSRPIAPEAVGRPALARIFRAQATLLEGRTQEAWEILATLDPETSPLPSWGGAWIHLVRGQIHDVRGERGEALAEYRRITSLRGARHSRRAAAIAESGIAAPFAPGAYEERPMVSAGP